MRPFKAALGRYSARYVGREIRHHSDDIASIIHSVAGLRSFLMRWTHDAVSRTATLHRNTAAWSDVVCTDAEREDVLALATARHIAGTLFKHHPGHPAPELRTCADVEPIADVDGVPVDEDPPVPHMVPELFEEEESEPDMLAPDGPETEEAHEKNGTPVLNRFLALCIVCSDGLRRMPSVR